MIIRREDTGPVEEGEDDEEEDWAAYCVAAEDVIAAEAEGEEEAEKGEIDGE